METYCNPLDLGYRYQHFHENGKPRCDCREGADPTLILFHGTYYLFVSMSAGFWYSEDLLNWKFHPAEDLQIYDYAPDVRQIGDWMVFSASRRGVPSPILRTKDPLHQPFEQISAPFPFWDPDMFQDDDRRVYFYWGCSNTDPIYGVEMDPETLTPIGEKKALIFDHEEELGYERPGDNGIVRPYIEGAFMTKRNGRYYLQYACPGTQYNIYSDGVYTSDSPLGPFMRQKSNPFSSVPGGFITGAGHGSTIADKYGNYWHAATMRISVNHLFERRVGLFPAGFDEEGTLYCNQNFADYPHRILQAKFDTAAVQPLWMLLNYRKPVTASSSVAGSRPEQAVDEDIRTWWSAAGAEPGEWICSDLGRVSDVRAIQVNLADSGVQVEFPEEEYVEGRHIEVRPQISHYTLETSENGTDWVQREQVSRECSNGYFEYPEGIPARYVRLTGGKLPYGQPLRVSGLRVFGNGSGKKTDAAHVTSAKRKGPMDAAVAWTQVPGADGYNVLYGNAPDRLYHSWLVYDETAVDLCTLMAGEHYYVRVDAFNENGITEGTPAEIG